MITKQPKPYIHGRKLVLSRQEQITFDQDKQYYLDLGYPEAVAEQYAGDHYYVNKRRTATTRGF